MDAKKRIIACCASRTLPEDTVAVDLSGFVLRLILFDKLILHSVRLREFPELVRTFGYGPVRELSSSKASRRTLSQEHVVCA